MSVHFAGYNTQDGYIHHWLVAGPRAIPVPDLERYQGDDFKLQILRHYHQKSPGIGPRPVEEATFTTKGAELSWRLVRCLDDHFVDLSTFHHTCHHLRAWAYARLESPSSQEVAFVLTTFGPADLWLNKWHVHRQERFGFHSVSFPAKLEKGHNEILVRCEQVALRACPYAVALQVVGAFEANPVLIPTSNKDVGRRQTLERVFEAAYLDQDVYSWDDEITVRWPEDLDSSAEVTARLQTPSGRIYAEAHKVGKPGDRARLQRPIQIPEGPFQVLLMPQPQEYYDLKMRVQRKIDLWSLRGRYSPTPYGSYQERCREALHDAAQRGDGIFSEIAKMALGQWSAAKADTIAESVEGINRRKDGSSLDLIGLLGMMHRFGHHPSFPEALQGPLEKCVLNFRYWADEPGSDAMCFRSENRQILFHTCEILAGQLYPDRIFPNIDQTGEWHREKGERMAVSWLHERATGGFRDWDSNVSFETGLVALSHLVDLADNQQVWEMAAVLMDKIFLSMALNSHRGVFGSTHGRTSSSQIKGGRLESTAGIGRLMWGMGAFNHHIRGTVSLACAEEYELPSIIQDIAADTPDEMWNRERHAGDLKERYDNATSTWQVNKVTYKTPDYMLCSAQDYRPGAKGAQEHVWQTTLDPDAVVFVTHPSCMSENDFHCPNFWCGNAILPRVAQWKDVLIAIHKLPENDWLGFTHAYFPVYAFDEHVLIDDADGHTWAFARRGQGYVALTAAQGLVLITRGDSAYRELRSSGQHNVWLCHMGRAALDGAFSEFQDRILALKPDFEGLSVRFATLRGESLAFGWEGPLSVDGKEQPITGFKHYDNPYCKADWPASQLEIRFRDQLLALDFGAESTAEKPATE
jgi:hypothetical protein